MLLREIRVFYGVLWLREGIRCFSLQLGSLKMSFWACFEGEKGEKHDEAKRGCYVERERKRGRVVGFCGVGDKA